MSSRYCIVRLFSVLDVYRPGDQTPWFQIERDQFHGHTAAEKETSQLELENLLRIALAAPAGPGCDYIAPESTHENDNEKTNGTGRQACQEDSTNGQGLTPGRHPGRS